MGIMDLLTTKSKEDINYWVEVQKNDPNSLLVDVRRQDEFDESHIPGAICLPFAELDNRYSDVLPKKDQRIYIYCLVGKRSKRAKDALVQKGYTNIQEIGGIREYTGDLEK